MRHLSHPWSHVSRRGIPNVLLRQLRGSWGNFLTVSFVIIYRVKSIFSHIAIRITLLVVMCASSMGVTTILTYCTMSHSSECCCSFEHQGATPGRTETPSVNYPDPGCNIQVVAGGVNAVALNVSGDPSVKSFTTDLIPQDPALLPLPVVSHQQISAHANDIVLPGGDLCIRNRALLI